MKVSIVKNPFSVDITCEQKDIIIEVEIQNRPQGKKILYVSINGKTILRLNRISRISFKGPRSNVKTQ